MITVVNKHKHKPQIDIYIGRGSILGNPYTHLELKNTKAEYQCKTREEAVDLYKKRMLNIVDRYEKNLPEDVQFRMYLDAYCFELQKIKEKAENFDVNLICFCSPQKCHGDVIKEIVEQYIKEGKNFI